MTNIISIPPCINWSVIWEEIENILHAPLKQIAKVDTRDEKYVFIHPAYRCHLNRNQSKSLLSPSEHWFRESRYTNTFYNRYLRICLFTHRTPIQSHNDNIRELEGNPMTQIGCHMVCISTKWRRWMNEFDKRSVLLFDRLPGNSRKWKKKTMPSIIIWWRWYNNDPHASIVTTNWKRIKTCGENWYR